MMMKASEPSPKLTLKTQLFRDDEALGPGKVALLEAIDRIGSNSAAGRGMGMSYRPAWLLVDGMNRYFADRLVDTIAGGGTNRGARLTAAEPLATLNAMLRERPVEPAGV